MAHGRLLTNVPDSTLPVPGTSCDLCPVEDLQTCEMRARTDERPGSHTQSAQETTALWPVNQQSGSSMTYGLDDDVTDADRFRPTALSSWSASTRAVDWPGQDSDLEKPGACDWLSPSSGSSTADADDPRRAPVVRALIERTQAVVSPDAVTTKASVGWNRTLFTAPS